MSDAISATQTTMTMICLISTLYRLTEKGHAALRLATGKYVMTMESES